MILLCGVPSEPPLLRVREELDALGAPCVLFEQRRFDEMELELALSGTRVGGRLRVGDRHHPLASFRGVYLRLMDDRLLPELEGEPEESPRRRACRELHDALQSWCEIAPARVVNRAGPTATNASKPYQIQRIRRHGFSIPETLVTSDPDAVRAFQARHGRVVYKSASGVRSVVRELGEADLAHLDRIRWCPTQFQAFVAGTDLRVHTVGGAVFATAIRTDATDYRYAEREGEEAELRPAELPAALARRCVALARALGLAFAGIDLRIAPDGRVFCFEVNPSPAFTYYEAYTGQPIARAVARFLAGA